MLRKAAARLIGVIRDGGASEAEVNAANEAFMEAFEHAGVDEGDTVLPGLVACLDCGDPARVGFAASVCGWLVSEGCDAGLVGPALIEKLEGSLEGSARLHEACVTELKGRGIAENEVEDEMYEETRLDKASDMTAEALAWDTLMRLWPAAISFFAEQAEQKNAAERLIPLAQQIHHVHSGAHWIYFMASVLTDEPVLVIEVPMRRGFVGRMSGIVENFQLHAFLMDAIGRRRFWKSGGLSAFERSVIDGTGPQQTERVFTGKWNMYTWRGLQRDLTLPEDGWCGKDHWIWGEGVPRDIDVFEGYRVILLGRASYLRTWRLQRIFGGLEASLIVEQRFSKAEVGKWLEKMAAAAEKR